jgi:Tol biopolymer transport system component
VLPLAHATVNPVAGLEWAPDGRSLLYVDTPRGVSNVWRLPLAGGPPRQVTRFDAGQIFAFALTRDGRRLAVARGGIVGDVVLIRDSR